LQFCFRIAQCLTEFLPLLLERLERALGVAGRLSIALLCCLEAVNFCLEVRYGRGGSLRGGVNRNQIGGESGISPQCLECVPNLAKSIRPR
jgi:hypothetical protein